MHDDKKNRIETRRLKYARSLADRSPKTRQHGEAYLEALSDLVRTSDEGAAGDPDLAGLDTTGELSHIREQAEWAEQERRRVRATLAERVL